ncbi:MAG: transcription antitermination factor NusB [Campylobacter sp.]|nr:transcription antitermination factor NusB [Campylobacter sp.]
MATRHQARQAIVSILYAYEMGSADEIFIDEFLEEKKIRNERRKDVCESVKNILQNQEKIDEILSTCLKDGDIEKIGLVERAILRLGIYEINFSDTDRAVVINEAIELAKELANDSSPKLVNAVLDAVKG